MSVPNVKIEEIATRNDMTQQHVQEILNQAIAAMTTQMKRISVKDHGITQWYSVERKGVGKIITPYGAFWEYVFDINDQWRTYNVIVKADRLDDNFMPVFINDGHVVIRTDSGCGTGQVFHDLTCDCREQLEKAMQTIQEIGEGMIIHIPNQDGRGMSLGFKLSTLTLQQELGVNTVESASMLAPGGVIDVRTYTGVIAILQFLGIRSDCKINLATNNPKKADIFYDNGYTIEETLPIVIPPTQHTLAHLRAKQEFMGHKNLVKEEAVSI
jgi:GTP cyclohydrolase II